MLRRNAMHSVHPFLALHHRKTVQAKDLLMVEPSTNSKRIAPFDDKTKVIARAYCVNAAGSFRMVTKARPKKRVCVRAAPVGDHANTWQKNRSDGYPCQRKCRRLIEPAPRIAKEP